MLTKSVLKRCGVVGLLAFGILWTQMPVKAQEKALREQLVEAKATIADQVWIIEHMKDNFFKVTGELNSKLDSLKTTNTEQAQTIKQITDNYFKVTGKLNRKLDELKAQRRLFSILSLAATVLLKN